MINNSSSRSYSPGILISEETGLKYFTQIYAILHKKKVEVEYL